jgi:hypothetical protein
MFRRFRQGLQGVQRDRLRGVPELDGVDRWKAPPVDQCGWDRRVPGTYMPTYWHHRQCVGGRARWRVQVDYLSTSARGPRRPAQPAGRRLSGRRHGRQSDRYHRTDRRRVRPGAGPVLDVPESRRVSSGPADHRAGQQLPSACHHPDITFIDGDFRVPCGPKDLTAGRPDDWISRTASHGTESFRYRKGHLLSNQEGRRATRWKFGNDGATVAADIAAPTTSMETATLY